MKKFILCCLFIVLIALILISALVIHDKLYTQDDYYYNSYNELLELFQNNIDEFNDYVEKFKDHKMWDCYYEKTMDKDFGNYKGFKKYTTHEEFEFLDSFFNKYRPYFWGRKSLYFNTDSGVVLLIKDETLSTSTKIKIDKAQKDLNAKIEYYKDGWIIIIYPPSILFENVNKQQ